MKSLNLLLALTSFVLPLADTTPTVQLTGDETDVPKSNKTTDLHELAQEPSLSYHGYAGVELWSGKLPINIGNVIGNDLYRAAYFGLWEKCSGHPSLGCGPSANKGKKILVGTHALDKKSKVIDSTTEIRVEFGQYENDQKLELLIAAIASALEAMTKHSENCYTVAASDSGQTWCNVGNVVRVAMSPKNRLYVRLVSQHGRGRDRVSGHGNYQCCSTRSKMDNALDQIGGEVRDLFGWYSRDVRCIIDGWKIC